MPLWVIIAAPLGVLAIVGLTWLAGGSSQAALTRDRIVELFQNEEPPQDVVEFYIDEHRGAAIALLAGGQLGVIVRSGRGLAWRLSTEGRLALEGGELVFTPGSIAFRTVRMGLGTEPLPSSIRKKLEQQLEERAWI